MLQLSCWCLHAQYPRPEVLTTSELWFRNALVCRSKKHVYTYYLRFTLLEQYISQGRKPFDNALSLHILIWYMVVCQYRFHARWTRSVGWLLLHYSLIYPFGRTRFWFCCCIFLLVAGESIPWWTCQMESLEGLFPIKLVIKEIQLQKRFHANALTRILETNNRKKLE